MEQDNVYAIVIFANKNGTCVNLYSESTTESCFAYMTTVPLSMYRDGPIVGAVYVCDGSSSNIMFEKSVRKFTSSMAQNNVLEQIRVANLDSGGLSPFQS